MDWTQALDGYCERTDPSFWAEPWNAVSNAAFLVTAALATVWVLRDARRDPAAWFLTVTLYGIGVGSFLFHTVGQLWAMIADVLPIGVFVAGYFVLALKRYVGLSRGGMVAVGLAFGALMGVSNGLIGEDRVPGIGYVPPLLSIWAVGGLLTARAHPTGRWILGSAAAFTLSFTARTLDLPLCEVLPRGTHYLWHLFNAVTLGLLMKALQQDARLSASRRP